MNQHDLGPMTPSNQWEPDVCGHCGTQMEVTGMTEGSEDYLKPYVDCPGCEGGGGYQMVERNRVPTNYIDQYL